MGAPFHMGGSGHVRGGSYTWDLDECRWAVVVGHLSVRGPWGREPVLGIPKD